MEKYLLKSYVNVSTYDYRGYSLCFRLVVFQINNLLVYVFSCYVRNRFTTTLSEDARSDFNARRCLCFTQCFKTFATGNMCRGGPFEPERHRAFIIGISIRVAYFFFNRLILEYKFSDIMRFNNSIENKIGSCHLLISLSQPVCPFGDIATRLTILRRASVSEFKRRCLKTRVHASIICSCDLKVALANEI